MKRIPRRGLGLGLAGLALATAGCVGGAVEADGPTPVYGEFGATGDWGYDGPAYDEGGVYVHPPYHGGDHRDDHGGPGPGRAAPSHAAARAPSIPSTPRPSGGGAHAGGGGGHPSGGGGGGNRR